MADNENSGEAADPKGLNFYEKMLLNKGKKSKMDGYAAAARKQCDSFAKQLADCATGRTISVAWACKAQRDEYHTCLLTFRKKFTAEGEAAEAAKASAPKQT